MHYLFNLRRNHLFTFRQHFTNYHLDGVKLLKQLLSYYPDYLRQKLGPEAYRKGTDSAEYDKRGWTVVTFWYYSVSGCLEQ